MHITIEWHDGTYPSFNVNLHRVEGAEEFLSIKGVRIVDGSKGEFLSWPATKNAKTNKYWNHVWGGEKFNEHVLALAKDALPKKSRPAKPAVAAQDEDIPF